MRWVTLGSVSSVRQLSRTFLLLSAYVCFGTKWNCCDRRHYWGESPESSHAVSEALDIGPWFISLLGIMQRGKMQPETSLSLAAGLDSLP